MTYSVEQVDWDGLPEEYKEEYDETNYANYLVIREGGKVREVHSDNMEPEDAVFYRDLSWIEAALEEAYELGLKK